MSASGARSATADVNAANGPVSLGRSSRSLGFQPGDAGLFDESHRKLLREFALVWIDRFIEGNILNVGMRFGVGNNIESQIANPADQ